MADVCIGTSGWNYPRGRGSWNGIFYPAGAQAKKGGRRFDELAFYAEHFDTVEVNSTFYRVPSVDMVRGWVRRTPRDFEFSLKLFQKFTHPGMFRAATGTTPSHYRRANLGSQAPVGMVRLAQHPQEPKPAPERPQQDEAAQFRQMARQLGINVEETRPRVVLRFPTNPNDMLLSGSLVGGQALSNKAVVADVPLGKGHVVMFATRPYWRWQTQGLFFLGFNAILNWNDLDAGKPKPAEKAPTAGH